MLQATLDREVENGTITPDSAARVAEIIPKVKQPPGSRSKMVVMSEAASWVRAANEAVTGRVSEPQLELEPPPLVPIQEEDPEGHEGLWAKVDRPHDSRQWQYAAGCGATAR
jgi:hypothetical protein